MPNECLANPALFFVTNHTVQKNPIQPDSQIKNVNLKEWNKKYDKPLM